MRVSNQDHCCRQTPPKETKVPVVQPNDIEEASTELIEPTQFGVFYRLKRLEDWIACHVGGEKNFELQGIDRILEEDKRPPPLWNALMIWPTMVLHLGMLPVGFLGPAYGLDFTGAMTACTVAVLAGAALPAYTATFGPRLGLRQMTSARYTFGYWGAKLPAVLMLIGSACFMVINAVIAGEALAAVAEFRMGIIVGCVLVTILSYFPTFFGFHIIMLFESYAWIAAAAIYIVLYAQATPQVDILHFDAGITGLQYAGAWLSFFSLQFSNSCGWAVLSADYYCNYPKHTSLYAIFGLCWLGLTIPLLFVNYLGIILGLGVFADPYHHFAYAYEAHGLGGVLLIAWQPKPWAKFALIIATLTVFGNNIATAYSAGISSQTLGSFFHKVPRFIWSFVITLLTLLLSVLGREHLSAIVSNFISLLGYWVVPFASMLILEDKVFRHGHDYDLTTWNDASKLPPGIAAIVTLFLAYFGGGFVGMAQVWFIGPIAATFGEKGGDVGIFMALGITLLVFPPLRWIERRWKGR